MTPARERPRRSAVAALGLMLAVVGSGHGSGATTSGGGPGGSASPPTTAPSPPPLALADAPLLERQTLQRLLDGDAWPRRAVAAMRLERYHCQPTADTLSKLVHDQSWQVRAFAARALGRRRLADAAAVLADETDPRVIRAVLRHRMGIDPQRVARAVQYLVRSGDLEEKMLGVELGLASGDESLAAAADESIRKIILRMDRPQAGSLSPRLAMITGQMGLHRPHDWIRWLQKQPRPLRLQPAWAVPDGHQPPPPGLIARIDPQRLADLESYIDVLSNRHLDLAIMIDCTASMSGVIAAAQGGIDDLMLFVGDVAASLRVGLVAYRDRQDQHEVSTADFTTDISEARRLVWKLYASGGGDTPESVYPAMQAAFNQLRWDLGHTKVAVLVGDAPPHVGFGAHCVALAANAAELGVVTHAVQARGKPVKHFDEIAKAGQGRCVNLADDESLVGEIAGLTIGDRFDGELREFFRTFLELCR